MSHGATEKKIGTQPEFLKLKLSEARQNKRFQFNKYQCNTH